MWGKESEKVRRMRQKDEEMGIRSNYRQYESVSGILAMFALGIIIVLVIIMAVCL